MLSMLKGYLQLNPVQKLNFRIDTEEKWGLSREELIRKRLWAKTDRERHEPHPYTLKERRTFEINR